MQTKKRKLMTTWLQENLHELLGYGNVQYGEVGYGAVVVNTSQIQGRSVKEIQAAGGIAYIPESGLPWTNSDTRLLVQQYNPQGEVVVVFRNPDLGLSAFRIGAVHRASGA
jgi:hypothetical protein